MPTPSRGPVIGLVLAAGRSTRLGRPKQLVRIGGQSILYRIVSTALASALDQVLVVLGYRAGEVATDLSPLAGSTRLKLVLNPEFDRGMSSSLQAGLRHMPEAADGVMVLLGDQPVIYPEAINRLIYAFLGSDAPLCVPLVAGARVTPVIFGRRLFPYLEVLKGDVGGRNVVNQFFHQGITVNVTGWLDQADLDTEDDYNRLTELLE
ncbi:MAG: nucleotidyltransferase family protein [Deltaproteobacteria bacterium]|nr:nucleotidyltransferase family protein [Deltaproteobacteria bacterium]